MHVISDVISHFRTSSESAQGLQTGVPEGSLIIRVIDLSCFIQNLHQGSVCRDQIQKLLEDAEGAGLFNFPHARMYFLISGLNAIRSKPSKACTATQANDVAKKIAHLSVR